MQISANYFFTFAFVIAAAGCSARLLIAGHTLIGRKCIGEQLNSGLGGLAAALASYQWIGITNPALVLAVAYGVGMGAIPLLSIIKAAAAHAGIKIETRNGHVQSGNDSEDDRVDRLNLRSTRASDVGHDNPPENPRS